MEKNRPIHLETSNVEYRELSLLVLFFFFFCSIQDSYAGNENEEGFAKTFFFTNLTLVTSMEAIQAEVLAIFNFTYRKKTVNNRTYLQFDPLSFRMQRIRWYYFVFAIYI